MTLGKFIVSAQVFYDFLNHLDLYPTDIINIYIKNGSIQIGGFETCAFVESNRDLNFDLTGGQVIRLKRICRQLQEQPITILVDDSNFIFIQSIAI